MHEPQAYFSNDQCEVMTARLAFVLEIERMRQAVSQQNAIGTLVAQAMSGKLIPSLAHLVVRANDRKTEDRTISERTLKRWLADYRQHGEAGLVPARRRTEAASPAWLTGFLRCYQQPTNPSVEASYAEFCAKYTGEPPSIHQVRRLLHAMPTKVRARGRLSRDKQKTLKQLKPLRAGNKKLAARLSRLERLLADAIDEIQEMKRLMEGTHE